VISPRRRSISDYTPAPADDLAAFIADLIGRLELGEGLLDQSQDRSVRWQEPQPAPRASIAACVRSSSQYTFMPRASHQDSLACMLL
jgi:hypothetical protein